MNQNWDQKSYEKNKKNLQTEIYLAFFSDLWYVVPKRSNEILFHVTSEKSYCKYSSYPLPSPALDNPSTFEFDKQHPSDRELFHDYAFFL